MNATTPSESSVLLPRRQPAATEKNGGNDHFKRAGWYPNHALAATFVLVLLVLGVTTGRDDFVNSLKTFSRAIQYPTSDVNERHARDELIELIDEGPAAQHKPTHADADLGDSSCDKCVAVCVQGPAVVPGFEANAEQDVFWLTFKEPFPESADGSFNIHAADTTWTTGRNLLLEMAMAQSERLRAAGKAGYEYYVFLDGDVVPPFQDATAKQLFSDYVRFLMREKPAASYPQNSVQWQQVPPCLADAQCPEWAPTVCMFDGRFLAFHRSTIGLVLPYDDSLDPVSWYASQHLADMTTNWFYGPAVAYFGFMGMNFLLGNTHADYQKDLDADYRYMDATEKYFAEALLNKNNAGDAMNAALAVVHSTSLGNTCAENVAPKDGCLAEYGADFKPWLAPKATPTADWLTNNMNADHSWVKTRLDFMSRHPAWFPLKSSLRSMQTISVCGVGSD